MPVSLAGMMVSWAANNLSLNGIIVIFIFSFVTDGVTSGDVQVFSKKNHIKTEEPAVIATLLLKLRIIFLVEKCNEAQC